MEEQEQNWIFTWGYGHQYPDRYIMIRGTQGSARERMINIAGNKWAFQYPEDKKESLEMQGIKPLTPDLFPENENETPMERGWYLCASVEDLWEGKTKYRAFGNDTWWIPLKEGWLSSYIGLYRWLGPVADIQGPAPDDTNPQ